jgi:hypothetical protein
MVRPPIRPDGEPMAEDAPSGLTPRTSRTDLLLWVALGLGLAAWVALMLKNLGYLSLWMDEGFHYLAAQGILQHGYPLYPSGHIYYKVALYTYVLAFASKIFGFTAATLRAVSVFCVAGVVGLAYLVGKRFFSRTIGGLAAVLLAFSVWEVEDARLALYFAPTQLLYLVGLYLFYQGFILDRKKFRLWSTVVFILIPWVHQLGMGLIFCYAALVVMKGLKRFFRKDVLISFGLVTLAYLAVQLQEFFVWKVGYVYEKTDSSLAGMFHYFFSSFNFDYFKEFFVAFPAMTLVVLGGFFLYLGTRLGTIGRDDERSGSPYLYLTLGLIFPLLFFGVFRTHVQPRYLAPLYPVFVFLFLAGLRQAAAALSDLVIAPFVSLTPKAKAAAAMILFLAAVFVLTEGVGLGKTMAVVNRRYKDPITADIITRSGRFEQEDNANTGLYVRHFLKPEDVVIAIHVVFEKIYVGRVDDWLWSGGPGTWDAWEKTPDGWMDFYVGARWLNNLEDLKKVVEGNPGRRVWLVGSTSLIRRDHINQEIADYLAAQKDKIVFRGWDGVSEVYLWNDEAGGFAGVRHTCEGEWLPSRRGSIVYGEEYSKQAAMAWEPGRPEDFLAEIPGEFKSGRYRLRLRVKADGGDGESFAAAVVSARTGERLRSLRVPAGSGGWVEPEISFALREGDRPNIQIQVRGASRVRLDYFDIVPEESGR